MTAADIVAGEVRIYSGNETVVVVGLLDLGTCVDHSYPANYSWSIPGSWCDPYTECELGVSYQLWAPNSTSDRVCQPVTECVSGEYQAVAPGDETDRVCAGCPVGSFSANYALECEDCKAVGRLYQDHDDDPTTPCVIANGLVYGWIMMALLCGILGAAAVPLYRRRENQECLRQEYRLAVLQYRRCERFVQGFLLRYACRKGKVHPHDKYEADEEYEYYSDEDAGPASLMVTSKAASKFLKNTKAKRALGAPVSAGGLAAIMERTKDSPPATPPVDSVASGVPGAIPSPGDEPPWRGEGRVAKGKVEEEVEREESP